MSYPPEVFKITGDEMFKIFPEQYYKKYAKHLEILELEKIIIDQQKKKLLSKQINFKSRRILPEEIPQTAKKVKQNRFDNYEEAIDKNKEELKRQNKYASLIDLKIKAGPKKKVNQIKPPIQTNFQLSDNVLNRLKALEDSEYQQQLRRKDKYALVQQQKLRCKFVSKSLQNSARRTLSPRRLDNPQKNRSKIVQSLQKIFVSVGNRNTLIIPSNNLENSILQSNNKDYKIEKGPKTVTYMNNMNDKIKKSHKTITSAYKGLNNQSRLGRGLSDKKMMNSILMDTNLSKNSIKSKKKDLIQETNRIREQVDGLKTISRYEELLNHRKIINIIQAVDTKNKPESGHNKNSNLQ